VIKAVLDPRSVAVVGSGLAPHPPWVVHELVSVGELLAPRGNGYNAVCSELGEVVVAEHITEGHVSLHAVDGEIELRHLPDSGVDLLADESDISLTAGGIDDQLTDP
jgi:hypothetical protein